MDCLPHVSTLSVIVVMRVRPRRTYSSTRDEKTGTHSAITLEFTDWTESDESL